MGLDDGQRKTRSPLRLILVVSGILVVEAVVIIGAMMLLGGPPDVEAAEAPAVLDAPEEEQIVEILVLDARLPNNKSGMTYLYDTDAISELLRPRPFQARLRELNDIPIVGDVRGLGLMACVECTLSNDGEDPSALNARIGDRIDAHCQELGLLVRPMYNMSVMSPPLTITREQIDEMVDILRRGIERAMEDVRREGSWNG